MIASGNSRSAVWFLNHASPKMHARLVSTIRSASACSSISSQTQPQKVQVAFFTTVRSTVAPFTGSFVRPNRTEGQTFSLVLGRVGCRECAAAYTVRFRSVPRLAPCSSAYLWELLKALSRVQQLYGIWQ